MNELIARQSELSVRQFRAWPGQGPAPSVPPRRRGTVYLLVLSTVLVVTVVGLASISLVRSQRREAMLVEESLEARADAKAAMDLGLHLVDSVSDWRSTLADGDWVSDQSIGAGTLTISAVDPVDGDVSDDEDDPVDVTIEVNVGSARQMLRARLDPVAPAMEFLGYGIHANGWVSFEIYQEWSSGW